ncbi:hypothetical protein A5753_15895 [Mycobacterium sp. 852002-51971_SCH5477799-a]|nr:hypothetical protein A5753_15895 [Mycobacterium sp. 852002-51971_SCH5477799-a]
MTDHERRTRSTGRPRDASIDDRVLSVTRDLLVEVGPPRCAWAPYPEQPLHQGGDLRGRWAASIGSMEDSLAEGFQFVAMARALLRDPYLIKRFREETAAEGLCIHCMKCMPTVYSGTHCVVRQRIEAATAR